MEAVAKNPAEKNDTNVGADLVQGFARIPKAVWYVGGAMATYWLVVKPLIKDLGGNSAQVDFEEDIEDLLKKPAQDNSHPTISANEAKGIANVQQEAMGNPGTNEARLFASLEGLNGEDLKRVYAAFGARWYDPLTGSTSGKWWLSAESLDLFGWYAQELSNANLLKMQNVWAKSGLSFFGKSTNTGNTGNDNTKIY